MLFSCSEDARAFYLTHGRTSNEEKDSQLRRLLSEEKLGVWLIEEGKQRATTAYIEAASPAWEITTTDRVLLFCKVQRPRGHINGGRSPEAWLVATLAGLAESDKTPILIPVPSVLKVPRAE